MHWYKRDPDAALAGMAELSCEERGAYNSLLDVLYSRDGIVPDEDHTVARMMSVDVRTWRALKKRLIDRGKIWVKDGLLNAKRVDRTLTEARNKSETQANNARQRWEKYEKRKENNDSSMPSGNASTTTSTTTSTKKEQILETRADARKKQKATRLPEDWSPDLEGYRFAVDALGSRQAAQREFEKFRDYWKSKAGAGATKLDWAATWRNWIRNVETKGKSHGQPRKTLGDIATELADEARELEFAAGIGRPPTAVGGD